MFRACPSPSTIVSAASPGYTARRRLDRFLSARVAVIGVGGVGSWAVESLARSGVGNLTLVDLDEICVTNVNRQLHAMDGQIGRQKTEAMADRARAIHPAGEITIIPKFFTEKSAAEILDAGFDAVIDAIDTTRHKALLLAECRAARDCSPSPAAVPAGGAIPRASGWRIWHTAARTRCSTNFAAVCARITGSRKSRMAGNPSRWESRRCFPTSRSFLRNAMAPFPRTGRRPAASA